MPKRKLLSLPRRSSKRSATGGDSSANLRVKMGPFLASMALSVFRRVSQDGKHLVSRDIARDYCTNYKSRFVQIDDHEIHYRIEGQGPTLVLLHGFGGSLHAWEPWAKKLSEHYRIVRLDLPGFGLSSPVKGKKKISFFTGFIGKFLDEIGVEDCFMAGNSLGGWMAWEFTGLHPERVKKLVLLNSAGIFAGLGKPKGVQLMESDDFKRLLRSGLPKIMIRTLTRNTFAKRSSIPKGFVDKVYCMANQPGMLASMIYIASSDPNANLALLREIDQPTLIMWGAADSVIPVGNALKFAEEIANSELHLFKGVGHVPMMEIADESSSILLKFLKK